MKSVFLIIALVVAAVAAHADVVNDYGLQVTDSLTNPALEKLAQTFDKNLTGDFNRFGVAFRLKYKKTTQTPLDVTDMINQHIADANNRLGFAYFPQKRNDGYPITDLKIVGVNYKNGEMNPNDVEESFKTWFSVDEMAGDDKDSVQARQDFNTWEKSLGSYQIYNMLKTESISRVLVGIDDLRFELLVIQDLRANEIVIIGFGANP